MSGAGSGTQGIYLVLLSLLSPLFQKPFSQPSVPGPANSLIFLTSPSPLILHLTVLATIGI